MIGLFLPLKLLFYYDNPFLAFPAFEFQSVNTHVFLLLFIKDFHFFSDERDLNIAFKFAFIAFVIFSPNFCSASLWIDRLSHHAFIAFGAFLSIDPAFSNSIFTDNSVGEIDQFFHAGRFF